jgi:hypothetical protein
VSGWVILLSDRIGADFVRERRFIFGQHEYRPGHQSPLPLCARPTWPRDLFSPSYRLSLDHMIGYTYNSRHLFLDVKLLALLVCVQLPPKLRHDLTIDMPLVSVNLLVSHPLTGTESAEHTLISATFQSLTTGFVGSLFHWKYTPLTTSLAFGYITRLSAYRV